MSVARSPRPESRPSSTLTAKAGEAATAMDARRRLELTARLAYDLYEKRGRADGHDIEDWVAAEKTARDQL